MAKYWTNMAATMQYVGRQYLRKVKSDFIKYNIYKTALFFGYVCRINFYTNIYNLLLYVTPKRARDWVKYSCHLPIWWKPDSFFT